eukprot:TRINITY_DN2958_c0_g1_i16.p1 TRINITY_DN2958_c0_g1~~TRINITY_DN2958_c0_g1_i16.p1  ORF type:complete len:141 (-),score=43.22 TRINITY_DN2958_c0_g1_i16:97-519(-)
MRSSPKIDQSLEQPSEEQGYGELIKSINECLTKQQRTDESDEPSKEVPALPKFLSPDGNPLVLPGINDRDSLGLKLEALRIYLEKQIGEDKFYKAYKFILDPPSEEDENSALQAMLGRENVKFIPLIYQLIVCEDSYYSS